MEDNTINIIRESTRNLIKWNRRIHKNEESDLRRCIYKTRITSENILEISNKLKTKSAVSADDLQMLKNGLMEDVKYVKIVLGCHGALRGIIRELTGHNIKKKIAAAGCCCNLALGDVRACTVVAKAAGSYLVAELDSFTSELPVTCAWALGNLARGSAKICDILISQGALAKLSDFYNDQDLQDAALYALTHFTYQMRDGLKMDYFKQILATLSKVDITTASVQLLFLLSCHTKFTEHVNEDIFKRTVKQFPISLKNYIDTHRTDKKLLYMIRTLANMDNYYNNILNFIDENNMYGDIKILLQSDNDESESLCWLVGNLLNFCDNKDILCKLYS